MWQKKIYLSFADNSAEKDVHMGVHFKVWIDLFCGSITKQHLSQAVTLFSDFSAFDIVSFFCWGGGGVSFFPMYSPSSYGC